MFWGWRVGVGLRVLERVLLRRREGMWISGMSPTGIYNSIDVTVGSVSAPHSTSGGYKGMRAMVLIMKMVVPGLIEILIRYRPDFRLHVQ